MTADEIKKYIARERRKKLPENIAFWDFDCRIGETLETASPINVGGINPSISKLEQENESFYIEILAKLGSEKVKKTGSSEKKRPQSDEKQPLNEA